MGDESPVIDFDAIAGDDVMTTQLDLARALIEAGKSEAAKSILQSIVSQGSQTQQAQAAKTLLGSI
jgi:pilus assembly protein FimV